MEGVAERFWSKVAIGGPDECWIWTACRSRWGYGRFVANGKEHHAHRVAWTLAFGPIPEGMCVCHRCDARDCVNPRHLFLATNGQNMDDMVAKGRSARGERNSHSKLTEAQVLEVRALWVETDLAQCEIGEMFGVRGGAISRIVHGKRWGWVGGMGGTPAHRTPTPRGERNGNSKLTAAQVVEIRALWGRGGLTQRRIAEMFGVTRWAVREIVRRRNWAWLKDSTAAPEQKVEEDRDNE